MCRIMMRVASSSERKQNEYMIWRLVHFEGLRAEIGNKGSSITKQLPEVPNEVSSGSLRS
jgi:hypothetical protein